MTRVALVVGSARARSVHLRLAQLTARSAPPGVVTDLIDELDRLPLYNEDLDRPDTAGEAVATLRARIAAADALLLFAPANNGSLSAVLKNALDWASRPYGDSSLSGAPVAVVSAAHRTDTVLEHAHLVASIAGGIPVDRPALFGLGGLDFDDPAVAAALGRTLRAVARAAEETSAA